MPSIKEKSSYMDSFKVAVDLMIFEGELLWSKFTSMLTAQSLLVALIAILLNSATNTLLVILLSIAGLVLCFLWFQITSRGFSFNKYYTLVAREMEEKMNDDLNVLRRGYKFKNGQTIAFNISNQADEKTIFFSRPWYSNLLSTPQASYLTIMVFAVIYLSVFAMTLRQISFRRQSDLQFIRANMNYNQSPAHKGTKNQFYVRY